MFKVGDEVIVIADLDLKNRKGRVLGINYSIKVWPIEVKLEGRLGTDIFDAKELILNTEITRLLYE